MPAGHEIRNRIIAGKYPVEANEILVSSYFLDCVMNMVYTPIVEGSEEQQPEKINSAEQFVGKKLLMGDVFTVTGVFDSGTVPAKYDSLKEYSQNFDISQYLFYSYIGESLHGMAFVSDSFVDEYIADNRRDESYYEYFNYSSYYYTLCVLDTSEELFSLNGFKIYSTQPDVRQHRIMRFDDGNGELASNQFIVPGYVIVNYVTYKIDKENEELINSEPLESDYDNKEEFQQAYMNYRDKISEFEKKTSLVREAANLLSYNIVFESNGERLPTESELTSAFACVKEYLEAPFMLTVYRNEVIKDGNYQIVGIYLPDSYRQSGIYCSEEFYNSLEFYSKTSQETKYTPEEDAKYRTIILPMQASRQEFAEFLKLLNVKDPENDVIYELSNTLYGEVIQANELVDQLSLIFLIIGIVLAIFSSLLLFNFISMSISNKKKEIGILRAVGARGTDVFKIFFSESGLIVGICIILAIIGSIVISVVLNSILKMEVGLEVALFNFGPLSVLVMLGVAVIVAFISTFLPVYLAARKKPVDSIRAL